MDLIIKNGLILDGLGNPWFHADVGIDGKKIIKIGKIREKVEDIIDAKGMIVAPGFIDIHNHSDVPLLVSGRAESMVHQGVTTMLTCNCGSSPFPLFGESLEHAKIEYSNNYNLKIDWSTLSEYEKKLENQGISINVALQIGQGTVRAAIMGYENRAPNLNEMEEMKQIVSYAMERGCFGISTGLGYPPGMFAKTDEIIELCKVVAKYGGIYSTHTRGFGPLGFPQKIQEALEIGEKAGLPVQMSHIGSSTWGRENWGKARAITLNIIDTARARGIDFTADIYPYIAGSGNLNSVLPTWVHEGGLSKMLDRLARPEIREKIAQEIKRWDWSQLLMYHLRTKENKIYEGKTVQQVSEMKNLDPINLVCNILIEENGSCPIWDFFGLEEDIRTLIKHEAIMIGSDGSALEPKGILGQKMGHPRNYGAYPKILDKYVREGVLSLPEAIRKMSGMPAWRLGLNDRGVIKPGAFADIVIFDPYLVKEKGTWTSPNMFPEGILYVLVNGTITIETGNHAGALKGEILHKSGSQ